MSEADDMIPTKEQLQKAFEQRHGRALQEKFSSATVAICGLGGRRFGIEEKQGTHRYTQQ